MPENSETTVKFDVESTTKLLDVLNHSSLDINEAISLISNKSADPDTQNQDGKTLLHLVAEKNPYLISTLLERTNRTNIDVTIKDKAKNTPLVYLLNRFSECSFQSDFSKCFDAAIKLIKMGEDPDTQNQQGKTLLHLVAEKTRTKIKNLSNSDAFKVNVNITDKAGNTPLVYLLDEFSKCNFPSDASECFNLAIELIEMGADLNTQNQQGKTLLHLIAEKIRTKIKNFSNSDAFKVNVNITDKAGNTPLVYLLDEFSKCNFPSDASECFNLAIELIERGADLNTQNKDGKTLLLLVAEKIPNLILTLLERTNIDITIKDETEKTALDYLSEHVFLNNDACKALVARGVNLNKNINTKTDNVKVILKLIAEKTSKQISASLQPTGDNFSNSNNTENTSKKDLPTQQITESSQRPNDSSSKTHIDSTSIVQIESKDLNNKNTHGNLPLHLAIKNSQWKEIPKLLSMGADPTIKDNDNKTAFDYLLKHYPNSVVGLAKQYLVLAVAISDLKNCETSHIKNGTIKFGDLIKALRAEIPKMDKRLTPAAVSARCGWCRAPSGVSLTAGRAVAAG